MNKTTRRISVAGIVAVLLIPLATAAWAADDDGEVMRSRLPSLRPELQPAADRL